MLSLSQLLALDAATDPSECGVAINLTGNMQCLEEYDLYISRSLGIPDEVSCFCSMYCFSFSCHY